MLRLKILARQFDQDTRLSDHNKFNLYLEMYYEVTL